MKMMKNEEGVSPVIGVILMVAITVILAAMIAVFVFGLAGDLEGSAQKDVTIQTGVNDQGNITFKVFAGSDVNTIDYMIISNGSGTNAETYTDDQDFDVRYMNTTVFKKSGGETIFTAVFKDGTKQIVATAP